MNPDATVTQLSIAPVKGMRLVSVDELTVEPSGARGDRAFCVVDPKNVQQLTTRTARLQQIVPSWDGSILVLRFPDGTVVAEPPVFGAQVSTANYEGRPVRGRLVDGALAEAVSEHLRRPVRLFAHDAGERLADDAPVTLMSGASLAALAAELDGTVPDARRFRMTIAIDGADAWEEHGWQGRTIAVGGALLRGLEPVPRCVVTTRDPDSGRTDLPVLAALARLRGKRDVTFGLWCEVLEPGAVRLGDRVRLAS
jgi:hypothetical protein